MTEGQPGRSEPGRDFADAEDRQRANVDDMQGLGSAREATVDDIQGQDA